MIEDIRRTTVDTYNNSAQALAEFFSGIGSRVVDIDRAFQLAGNPTDANVLEIGCGDGRDAAEICRRTPNYLGTDVSSEMIRIARERVQNGRFEIRDAATMDFPQQLDIVFAFASLLHLSKSENQRVFKGVAHALQPGGIFYTSLKWRTEYSQELKQDQFGRRLFYFYNQHIIESIAGEDYDTVGQWEEQRGDTKWFEMALRKR